MKKTSFFFFLVTALLLSSCTEHKVKKMAKEFVVALNDNDSSTIAKLYPGSILANKLTKDWDYDSLSVEEVADTFVVHLNGGRSLSLAKNEDGNLKIVDSRGLFHYSDRKIELGIQTGWITHEMSDMRIAEQFADTAFMHYLAKKTHDDILSSFQIFVNHEKYVGPNILWEISANNVDYSLRGSDYEFIVENTPTPSLKVPGVDLEENSVGFKTAHFKTPIGEIFPQVRAEFTISDEELLEKYGWFDDWQGEKEYEKYLRSPLNKKGNK